VQLLWISLICNTNFTRTHLCSFRDNGIILSPLDCLWSSMVCVFRRQLSGFINQPRIIHNSKQRVGTARNFVFRLPFSRSCVRSCRVSSALWRNLSPWDRTKSTLRYVTAPAIFHGCHSVIMTTLRTPKTCSSLPPIRWVPGALSLGVKSPYSSAEIRNAWIYTSAAPIRLNGLVLS
jgi:hypothetical protein